MGCGSSTPAAGEPSAPQAASKYQQHTEGTPPAQVRPPTKVQAPESTSADGAHAAAVAAAKAHPANQRGHRGSIARTSIIAQAGPPVCLHTARVIASSLVAPYAPHGAYRGAGTSWGLVKAPKGSGLSAETPYTEWQVLVPMPGDCVRIGVMPRSAQLKQAPGTGAEWPSSCSWSPATGNVLVAHKVKGRAVSSSLEVGDRVALRLIPSSTGAHRLEFLLNESLVTTADVPLPPSSYNDLSSFFVPVLAVQGGASIMWSGACHPSDGAEADKAGDALEEACEAWWAEMAELAAENDRVTAEMTFEKQRMEREIEDKAARLDEQQVAQERAALAARAEAEKLARAERQALRMSELDRQLSTLATSSSADIDPHEETAKVVEDFEREEDLAAARHKEEERQLLAKAAERKAARRTIQLVKEEEKERRLTRQQTFQDRALRMLVSPIRRAAVKWRDFTDSRREIRQAGGDPNKRPSGQGLGLKSPGTPVGAKNFALLRNNTFKNPSRRSTGGQGSPMTLGRQRSNIGSPSMRNGTLGGVGGIGGSPMGLTRQRSIGANPPPLNLAPAPVVSSFRSLPKVKNLSDKVVLEQYDGMGPDGLKHYEWIVRNQQLERLMVTMNFEKCKGMELHGTPQQKCVLKGFESKIVAVITQASRTAAYTMSYGISCIKMPVDPADVLAASAADNELVEQARRRMQATNIEPVPVATGVRVISPTAAATTWTSLHTALTQAGPGTSFFDTSFPPSRASVYSKGEPVDNILARGTKGSSPLEPLPLAWRRLFSFLPDGVTPSFYDPVADPNDISQGKLGNCWMCSALSSVGETPELVANLFSDEDRTGAKSVVGGSGGGSAHSRRLVQRINAAGVYSVRLCVSGKWTWVLLDDFFPCYPNAGPLFTQNHGTQIWVLLVEKGFAKLYGGYDALVSGQAHHALADLTGCPVKSWQLAEPANQYLMVNGAKGLWTEMLEGARQDLSMCAATVGKEHSNDDLNALLKSVGLVAGHAYSVLHCMEVPAHCSTSAGTRLIELRNPWGNGEWNGAWSDNSPLWTQELRDVLKPNIGNSVEGSDEDGIFYMALEDFQKYFVSVATCFIRSPQIRPWAEKRFSNNWLVVSTQAEAEDETGFMAGATAQWMYDMEVREVSDVWAVLYQPDALLPGATPLIDHGIMIMQVDGAGASMQQPKVVIDTQIERNRQTNETATLQPGKYIVLPCTNGARLKQLGLQERGFNLAILSDETRTVASLRPLPYSAALLNAALLSVVTSRGKCEVIDSKQTLSMYQLRYGNSHLYGCSLAATAAHPMRMRLDSATSSNAASHRSETNHSFLLQPGGPAHLYHFLTAINEKSPTSYNVDIHFKSEKPKKNK